MGSVGCVVGCVLVRCSQFTPRFQWPHIPPCLSTSACLRRPSLRMVVIRHGGGGPGEDSVPAFFYETDSSDQRPGKRVGRGRDGAAVNLRTGRPST